MRQESQGQVLLGSERFVERLTGELPEKRPLKEIPRRQRFATRPPLCQLFPANSCTNRARRNEFIRRAHLEHGYGLSEIGRVVGLQFNHQLSRESPGW